MRKGLVKKIKSGKYSLHFDNGNVEQLNELNYAIYGHRGLAGTHSKYIVLGGGLYGVTKTTLPTIKLSKIFKPKKKKDEGIEWITYLKKNGAEESIKNNAKYVVVKYVDQKPIIIYL